MMTPNINQTWVGIGDYEWKDFINKVLTTSVHCFETKLIFSSQKENLCIAEMTIDTHTGHPNNDVLYKPITIELVDQGSGIWALSGSYNADPIIINISGSLNTKNNADPADDELIIEFNGILNSFFDDEPLTIKNEFVATAILIRE